MQFIEYCLICSKLACSTELAALSSQLRGAQGKLCSVEELQEVMFACVKEVTPGLPFRSDQGLASTLRLQVLRILTFCLK